MSDLMLYGVLEMPFPMAMSGEIAQYQFWSRAQEAAKRLKVAEARLAEIDRVPVSTPQQSAQRASVETGEFIHLMNLYIDLSTAPNEKFDVTIAHIALKNLIAHINAWGSAGSGATDGWISVNERLPARCEEVFVWPCPSDYCMTAEMWSLEPAPGVKWVHNEYVTGYGNEKVTMHRAPTHWRPIFAAPSPVPQGEQA